MEIREMTIDDIQMRMSAIKEEMEVEGADLDALEAEVTLPAKSQFARNSA